MKCSGNLRLSNKKKEPAMKPTPLITSNKTGYLLTNFLVKKIFNYITTLQKYYRLKTKNMTTVMKKYDIYHVCLFIKTD